MFQCLYIRAGLQNIFSACGQISGCLMLVMGGASDKKVGRTSDPNFTFVNFQNIQQY